MNRHQKIAITAMLGAALVFGSGVLLWDRFAPAAKTEEHHD